MIHSLISICLTQQQGTPEKSSMELEMALKITRTRDDLTSELRIAKDRAGPVFLSRETKTTLVLTAHLKGFKQERIKIVINEDGTQIAISGEKAIQEMVMVKWIMYKKEAEIRGFQKFFWIPDGIILDRIKAKFNEEDSILTIVMPKKTRGIQGIEIEEVKQEHFDGETSETTVLAEKDTKREDVQEELQTETQEPKPITREDGNRIGETSSESPEISHEESSELASPEAVEFPATTIPDHREEITKPEELQVEPGGELNQPMTREDSDRIGETSSESPKISHEESSELASPEAVIPDHREEITEPEELKVEPGGELNQSIAPDSLPSEEMLRGELPTLQPEKKEEHEIPEAKAPEGETHEHDLGPDIAKRERGLHEPQTPETPPTQQIGNEELPEEEITQVPSTEPDQEEQDRGPEIELSIAPKPVIGPEHFNAKTSGTTTVLDDKDPKRDDVQEELQQPVTREDGDQIGGTSSESPKISHEESSELLEFPATTTPDHREEITRREELKVEPGGELNQSIAPNSLPSEEMLPGELPTLQPEKTDEYQIPKAKAPEAEPHEHDLGPDTAERERGLHEPQTPETPPTQQIGNEELPQEEITQVPAKEPEQEEQDRGPEIEISIAPKPVIGPEHFDGKTSKTTSVLADKDSKRDDVQEEPQQPLTREDSDQIGETSSESPKISREESSELVSPEAVEFPATTIPDHREEINRREELKVEPGGELNQSIAPDSLPSEEMLPGELPTLQPEKTEEHKIPEAKAPKAEPHEHDLGPDTVARERGLNEPQTPETPPTQQIGNEELPQEEITQVPAKEPEQEEQDRGPEIEISIAPKPVIGPEHFDCKTSKTTSVLADKNSKRDDVQEEPQQPLTREDGDQIGETSSESPKISREESSELVSPEAVEFPATTIPDHREEINRREELKVEPGGELNQSIAPDSLPSEEMLPGELPTLQPEKTEEHKIPEAKAPKAEPHEHDLGPDTVERERGLNEPQTPEMPPTQQIGNEELPQEEITQVQQDRGPEIEISIAPKPVIGPEHFDGETSETTTVLSDNDPKRDDVQEKLQPETKEPKPANREDGDWIGETSSESPKISHEESSELASPEAEEFPAKTIPDHRGEITRPEELRVEPGGELNQSIAPDSLLSEEMLPGEVPTLQPEKTEEHEIPKAKAPEGEPHEHDLGPDTAERERRLHEPETPKMHPTQQIGNEELPQEEITQISTEEPEQEQNQGPEIEIQIGTPETPNRDQPVAQESEDRELDRAEEVHEEVPEVRGEEEVDGEVVPPGKDRAEGEPVEEGFAESEESNKEEFPKVEQKKNLNDRLIPDRDQPVAQEINNHKLGGVEEVHEELPRVRGAEEANGEVFPQGEDRIEGEPNEEGFAKSKESDKEESPKVEPNKKINDRSTLDRDQLVAQEIEDRKMSRAEEVHEEVPGVRDEGEIDGEVVPQGEDLTEGKPDEEGFTESKESNKVESPKVESKKDVSDHRSTPGQYQPIAQEIKDRELSGAEELHEELPRVQEEEDANGEVGPQGEDQTKGEPNEEGFAESEESDKYLKVEKKKNVGDRSTPDQDQSVAQEIEDRKLGGVEEVHEELPWVREEDEVGGEVVPQGEYRTEGEPIEEGFAESEESLKVEQKKNAGDRLTLDRDQSVAQEIEDHKLGGVEEVYEEQPWVQEEEEFDGEVVPRGEDRTEGEPNEEGFSESEESDKEKSPKVEPKKNVSDRSTPDRDKPVAQEIEDLKMGRVEEVHEKLSRVREKEEGNGEVVPQGEDQTEGEPDEGFVESKESDKEESLKVEQKKNVDARSNPNRDQPVGQEIEDRKPGGVEEVHEELPGVREEEEVDGEVVPQGEDQTKGEPDEEGFAESKESNMEESLKVEPKENVKDQSTLDRDRSVAQEIEDCELGEANEVHTELPDVRKEEESDGEVVSQGEDRTEGDSNEEVFPKSEESNKEESPKTESKKNSSDRSTPYQDQPVAQSIEDHELGRVEEEHEELSGVREEEEVDGEVVPQGEDQTEGQPEEEVFPKSEESDKEESPKPEPKKIVNDRSNLDRDQLIAQEIEDHELGGVKIVHEELSGVQEEEEADGVPKGKDQIKVEPDEEGLTELEGSDKEESPKVEPKKNVSDLLTPNRDHPVAQEIEDCKLGRVEEVHKELPGVREEEDADGEVVTQGEDRTEGEPDEEVFPESEESDKEESPKPEPKKIVNDRSNLDRDQSIAQEIEDHELGGVEKEQEELPGVQEEEEADRVPKGKDRIKGEPDEEGLTELEESDKEESLKVEPKKNVSDLLTPNRDHPVAQEIEDCKLGGVEEVHKELSGVREEEDADGEVVPQGEDQTEGEPDEEGLAKSEESDKEASPKVEQQKNVDDRSTPDRDQPIAQEIEDRILGGVEEVHKIVPQGAKKADGEVLPQGEDRTKGELDEGFVESKESDKEESSMVEQKKNVSDRSIQTDEGFAESEESDKEESLKAKPKKNVSDRSTQTERWSSQKPPLCPSLFVGSALFVSLIVLAFQLLKNKKKR